MTTATTSKHSPLSPSWFAPTGRTASLKAGLPSYASKQWCSVSGHDNIRRPRDNKCCACLAMQSEKAKAQEAALIEALRQSTLKWARAEVRREAARKAKQEAAEKAKAEKLAIRVQAQKDRDRLKRQAKAQARAQEKAQALAEAQTAEQAQEAAKVPQGGLLKASGGCPWE